jgi:hypothetical protein
MATGGWPDLSPLAVGVDRGHPQWPDLSLFFFFFFSFRRRDKWPLGVAGSLSSGRWGGLRPPPVAGSIFFFFFVRRKSRGDGDGRRRLFAGHDGG